LYEKSVQQNKINSLNTAIYVSKHVCVGWHRTGAYYTAKLTFSHGSSVKVRVRIEQVCILYSNFLRYYFSRWVTVSGFNSRWETFISVCDQPPRSTQPGHPFVGRHNEYQLKGGDALRLGSKGRYSSCVDGR